MLIGDCCFNFSTSLSVPVQNNKFFHDIYDLSIFMFSPPNNHKRQSCPDCNSLITNTTKHPETCFTINVKYGIITSYSFRPWFWSSWGNMINSNICWRFFRRYRCSRAPSLSHAWRIGALMRDSHAIHQPTDVDEKSELLRVVVAL